jgi:hypothetical protein
VVDTPPAGTWRLKSLRLVTPLARADLFAPLMLLCITLVYFGPYLLTGKTPLAYDLLAQVPPWRDAGAALPKNVFMSDLITSQIPSITFYRRALASGQAPFWDPYSASGAPYRSDLYNYYPPEFLLLLGTLETGYLLFQLFHMFVTGLGAYWLFRRLALQAPAALAGACVWMLCGYLTVWRPWLFITATLAWLPWSLLAADVVATTPRWRNLVWLALATAMTILAGHPQHGYYCILATVAFGFWRALIRSAAWRQRLLAVTRLCAGWALGLALASLQLLQTWTALSQTSRQTLPIGDLLANSLPPRQLATLLVPDLFGNANTYYGRGNYMEYTGYVGVVTLCLFLFALLHPQLHRRTQLWFFLLFTAVVLHLAYGGILNWPLSYLPIYTSARGLQRFYGIWSIGMAALAAWGVEAVLLARGRRRWSLLSVAAVLLVIGLMLLGWPQVLASRLAEVGWSQATAVQMPQVPSSYVYWETFLTGPVRWLAWMLAGTALLVVVVTWFGQRRAALRPALGLAMALLICIDLIHFARSYLPVASPTPGYATTPGLAYLLAHASDGRVARWGQAIFDAPVPANSGTLFGLEDITSYSSLGLDRYHRLIGAIEPARYANVLAWNTLGNFRRTSSLNSPLLDLLGVRHLLTIGPISDSSGTQEESNQPVGELLPGHEVGQTFTVAGDGLYRVDLMLATYARTNAGRIQLELQRAPDDPEILAAQEVDAANLADNAYVPFEFAPIAPSAGRSFYVSVAGLDSSPGHAATAWSTREDSYRSGTLWRDGQSAAGDLRFRAYTQSMLDKKWSLGYAGPDMYVYDNAQAQPLAWLTGQTVVQATDAAQLAVLAAPTFVPAQAVLTADPPLPIDADARGATRLVSRMLNSIDMAVDVTAAPGRTALLILCQNFYPGWHAQVDRVATPLLRVDYTLTALQVPAGQHRVRLWYVPAELTIGLPMTLLALLACTLLWFWRGRCRSTFG